MKKKAKARAKKRTSRTSSPRKGKRASRPKGLSAKVIREIAEALQERRRALVEGVREDLREVVVRDKALVGDSTDLAQDLTEESVSLGILATEEEELAQIEAALRRIEEGTYGICEVCGEPIPLKRLRFLPYATKCVKCKSMEERAASTRYSPGLSFGVVEEVAEDEEGEEE